MTPSLAKGGVSRALGLDAESAQKLTTENPRARCAHRSDMKTEGRQLVRSSQVPTTGEQGFRACQFETSGLLFSPTRGAKGLRFAQHATERSEGGHRSTARAIRCVCARRHRTGLHGALRRSAGCRRGRSTRGEPHRRRRDGTGSLPVCVRSRGNGPRPRGVDTPRSRRAHRPRTPQAPTFGRTIQRKVNQEAP